MKLALFDFDGTITNQDSLMHFIRFSHGNYRFFLGLIFLSPVLIKYLFGLLNNQNAKEKVYKHYFYAWNEEKFQSLCNDYATQALPKIIRPHALEKINWHQAQGHRVIVVSASIENYLRPWCKLNDLELQGTKLQFSEKNGESQFTGFFSSLNCHGVEKRNRINSLLDLQSYEYIYAYGDSQGDKEMLELANESHFKPFRSIF